MVGQPSTRRRWRPRFSLRTLLLIALFCGCVLGWLGSEIRRSRRQQEAVLQVRELGGHASYGYQLNARSHGRANALSRFFRSFVGESFLADVRRISLHSPHATDDDLQCLRGFARLEDLRLNARNVTDAGLRHLRYLRQLERLDLNCQQVTDRGLQHIQGLRNLTELDLFGSQVSDRGLIRLRDLKRLRLLKVRSTCVTTRGVAELQPFLPDCRIRGAAREVAATPATREHRERSPCP